MKFFKTVLFKIFRFYIFGVVILFAVEISGLAYLNNVYFKPSDKTKIVKVSTPVQTGMKKMSVFIGSNSTHAALSYDGEYASYLSTDGVLHIIDLSNGKQYPIQTPENMQVMNYKWIYNRDRMIVAEKTTGTSKIRMRLYDFDITDLDPNASEQELMPVSNNDNTQLQYTVQKDTTLDDIELSTDTALTFLKVTTEDSSSIKAFNIQADPQQVETLTSRIGAVTVLKQDFTVLYESLKSGYIYVYHGEDQDNGNTESLTVDGNKQLRLIGSDENDILYVAPTDTTQTHTIYYGTFSDLTNGDYHTLHLDEDTLLSNIVLTPSGALYAKDDSMGVLTQLKAGTDEDGASGTSGASGLTKTNYTGKLIGIADNGFITFGGGTVRTNNFASSKNKN